MKVKVISSIPPRAANGVRPDWTDLAEITWATQKKYCERWGYSFHGDVSNIWDRIRPTKTGEPLGISRPISHFVKFRLMEHFLRPEQCGEEWDWIVWLDADLLLTKYEMRIESFFTGAQYGGDICLGDIVLTHDVNGLHATVIMLRRSPYTLGFAWANANAGQTMFQGYDWDDQFSMKFFLANPPYRDMAVFPSVKELCAMPPGVYPIPEEARKLYEWDENSLGLHLSALSIERRISIAKEYVEKLALL